MLDHVSMSLRKGSVWGWVAVLGSVCLTACAPVHPVVPVSPYMAPFEGFERFEEYPAEVAMYQRGGAIAHSADLKDYSVAYQRGDVLVQSAVTLYVYRCATQGAEQWAFERGQMLKAYPGAVITEEGRESFKIGSQEAEGDKAVFEYVQTFAGERQPVTSELLLFHRRGHCFKVRTTAPAAQRYMALSGVRVLLTHLSPRW